MLNVVAATATKLYVAGGSILSKDSVLLSPKPPHYTHHEIVRGLAFDITVSTIVIGLMFYCAYLNWGPPAKRKLAAQGGVDNANTLQQEGMLLGLQPWVWSIVVMLTVTVTVLGSILYYSLQ
jgi:hypothetical protein